MPTKHFAHRGYWPEQGTGNEATDVPPSHATLALLGTPAIPLVTLIPVDTLKHPVRGPPQRHIPTRLCLPWCGRVSKGKGQGLEPDRVGSNPGSSS